MSTSTGDFVNPPAFRLHRCYYCRTSKPDAIRYGGEIIYRLMYGRITPLRDNKGKNGFTSNLVM